MCHGSTLKPRQPSFGQAKYQLEQISTVSEATHDCTAVLEIEKSDEVHLMTPRLT